MEALGALRRVLEGHYGDGAALQLTETESEGGKKRLQSGVNANGKSGSWAVGKKTDWNI